MARFTKHAKENHTAKWECIRVEMTNKMWNCKNKKNNHSSMWLLEHITEASYR